MKKKILIIGKSGFIGSNLLKFLKGKNLDVTVASLDQFNKDYKKYHDIYSYIINCSIKKDFVIKKYNKKNDSNLIIANKISNSRTKLLMLSTRKIYETKYNIKETDQKKPKCNYSKNKLVSENSIKKILTLNYLILRISNVIGLPINSRRKVHNTFIDIFFKQAKLGIIYKNPKIYKDFISIKNLNEAVFKLITKNAQGIFNVSLGKKIYLNQIINWLNFYNKKKIVKVYPEKSFNNESFTLNNDKLVNIIKIKLNINDLKKESLKISKKIFSK